MRWLAQWADSHPKCSIGAKKRRVVQRRGHREVAALKSRGGSSSRCASGFDPAYVLDVFRGTDAMFPLGGRAGPHRPSTCRVSKCRAVLHFGSKDVRGALYCRTAAGGALCGSRDEDRRERE